MGGGSDGVGRSRCDQAEDGAWSEMKAALGQGARCGLTLCPLPTRELEERGKSLVRHRSLPRQSFRLPRLFRSQVLQAWKSTVTNGRESRQLWTGFARI